jgi:glucose-6-phosphate isomerase
VSSQTEITALWTQLAALPRPTLAQLFAADGARVEALTGHIDLGEEGGIRFDWSKTHLDAAHIACSRAGAAVDFGGQRAALFNGDKINVTEGRSAEHTAQRGVGATPASRKPWRCTRA